MRWGVSAGGVGPAFTSSDTGRVLDVVINFLTKIVSVLGFQVDGVIDSVDAEVDRFTSPSGIALPSMSSTSS